MSNEACISAVRGFNRYYTNILGLLDRYVLNSDFSLSEVRVLYEIDGNEFCTPKRLADSLKIDPGYLSRIIKRLSKLGLIEKTRSPEDGRSQILSITLAGGDVLKKLNHMSDSNIEMMVSGLSEGEKARLTESMKTIENILANKPALDKVSIRNELKPGDAGRLIQLHGWQYWIECGYNHKFEGYVCKTFYELYNNYSPEKDRFWLAESGVELIGSIAIVGHTDERAQLRYFIIHPDFRGIGLGRKLLGEALEYARSKGFKLVFLETTDDQKTASAMYRKAGFVLKEEKPNCAWGIEHTEQRYELTFEG